MIPQRTIDVLELFAEAQRLGTRSRFLEIYNLTRPTRLHRPEDAPVMRRWPVNLRPWVARQVARKAPDAVGTCHRCGSRVIQREGAAKPFHIGKCVRAA